MEQGRRKRKSEMAKGIFVNFRLPGLIHNRQIEPHLRQLPVWDICKIFGGGLMDSLYLRHPKPRHGGIEITGFLDFAKNDGRSVLQNHVNFTALAAPASFQQARAPCLVFAFDNLFRRCPRQKRPKSTILPRCSTRVLRVVIGFGRFIH